MTRRRINVTAKKNYKIRKVMLCVVPAYTNVTILLRSCGGAHCDSMACMAG